jgi:hypothetical protein
MANELTTVLPVLRERTVYVKNDGTGNDNSDYINKSFKGILRLSPNDSASYLEKENYISYNETTADYITFEDNISAQLEKQFIRVSTSDGYLLDLRISSSGVEYNNLYILGAAHTVSPLQLYAQDKCSFKLGNTYIVSDRNREIITKPRDYNRYVPLNDETLGETFILVNTNNNGMEFVNAKQLIDLFIKETLMELSSLPAGSIHGVPVNIEQYEALLKKSKGHNVDAAGNDSLIRDFLLCDGSYYRSTDFPELAKVLDNESIQYWKDITEDDSISNSRYSTHQELNSEINGQGFINVFEDVKWVDGGVEPGEPKPVRVFRVPDLRGMFFESALTGLNAKNTVGKYEKDSIKDPQIMIKHALDQHYHYMVLDNPLPSKNTTDGKLAKTVLDPEEYEAEGLIYDYRSYNHMSKNCAPAALARYGAILSNTFRGYLEYNCGRCCKNCRLSYGSSAIYKPTYYLWNCRVGGPSGGYILSTLNEKMSKSIKFNNWLGASSWSIDMSISTEDYYNDPNFDENINYTSPANDPIYAGAKKDYVSYDETMVPLLGYENTPEFYAILPLIKI